MEVDLPGAKIYIEPMKNFENYNYVYGTYGYLSRTIYLRLLTPFWKLLLFPDRGVQCVHNERMQTHRAWNAWKAPQVLKHWKTSFMVLTYSVPFIIKERPEIMTFVSSSMTRYDPTIKKQRRISFLGLSLPMLVWKVLRGDAPFKSELDITGTDRQSRPEHSQWWK